MLTCSCCGADITMPVFINGLPYGFVCANKIGYTGKKQSKKYVKLNVENILIKQIEGYQAAVIRFSLDGVRYAGRAYLDNDMALLNDCPVRMVKQSGGSLVEIVVYFIDGVCYKKVK